MKSPFWCLLFPALGLAASLRAAEDLPLEQGYGEEQAVPANAKITLQLPATTMIGEGIPAKLLIQNTGGEPFTISTGGDYRSTGYPWRVKVHVRDSAGRLLPVLPDEAIGFGGGGLMGGATIPSGKTEAIDFPLECYVSFTKAGNYTVTAGHDLGWKLAKDQPQPSAQATLTVTEPTAAQAAEHVKRIFDAQPATPPRDESDKLGREMKLRSKLCVLRQAIYLPPLRERAAAGSAAAVEGIGRIAVPEATEALLGLLDHASPEVVEAAVRQMDRRMASREDPTKPALWHPFSDTYQIDPLLPMAWKPEYEEPFMAAARKLLSRSETPVLEACCGVFYWLGEPKDAPPILAALQRCIDAYREPPPGPNVNTVDFPRPQGSLISVLDRLRARGWRADRWGGEAQMIAEFRELADKKIPKALDHRWEKRMFVWVENGSYTLRICALKAIPQPLDEEAAGVVLKALDAHNWGVIRAACEVAGESTRPTFARPLAQVIESIHHSDVQRAAHEASLACGARMELWKAWTSVITDQERMHDAVSALILGVIDLPSSTGGGGDSNYTRDQRFAIRDAWRDFLQKHAAQLASGQRITPPDEATTAALTGTNFRPGCPVAEVRLKDGTHWPPKVQK